MSHILQTELAYWNPMYTVNVLEGLGYRDKDPAYQCTSGMEEVFGGHGSYDLSYLAGGCMV